MCSYLLSLPELPLPPQLDQNYTHADLLKRVAERESAGTNGKKNGWVVVGAGSEYHDVQVDSPDHDGMETPARSERIDVSAPSEGFTRSTNSSTTTISRPSPPPSIDIPVLSTPSFEPIAVGDEGAPGEEGQKDRSDGRVDEVFRLHSSRRMKPTSSGRGVSIPSRESRIGHHWLTPRTSMVPIHTSTVFEPSAAGLHHTRHGTRAGQIRHDSSSSSIRVAEAAGVCDRRIRWHGYRESVGLGRSL